MAPSLSSDKSNVTVEGTVDLYSHEREKYIKMSDSPICVDWRMGTDPDGLFSCQEVKAKGRAYTTSDIDFTIKVRALQIYVPREYVLMLSPRSKPRA